jgi:hypothetical protein
MKEEIKISISGEHIWLIKRILKNTKKHTYQLDADLFTHAGIEVFINTDKLTDDFYKSELTVKEKK